MTYETIFFDLDGTLTDPAVGITGGVLYALDKFGIHEENREKLYPFIGPPLMESFQEFYGFTVEQAQEAIAFYREYYIKKGMYENQMYEGIPQMLEHLRLAGKRIFVATYKTESLAREILEHFQIASCFDGIAGPYAGAEELPKSQLIEGLLEQNGIRDRSRAVMVGDRKYDVIAAQESGVHSVGVLYGYGSREELTRAGAELLVSHVQELEKILLE